MAFALTWMPDVLLKAGLRVAEVDGWSTRGHGDMGTVVGAMIHHTVGPKTGNMPSLRTLVDGRSDLPGPLAQLGLGRDGTWYVIAAGRAHHAGNGNWRGITSGNTRFIGIECENTGGTDDLPWPDKQRLSLRHGVAALLRHTQRSAEFCVGHKEFALPPGRKIDPLIDMPTLRQEVAALLVGSLVPLPPVPAMEAAGSGDGATPGVRRPTLQRGAKGSWVATLQRAVGVLPVDGDFGAFTEAAVRQFQLGKGLVPDGVVGPKTWAAIPP